MTNVDRMRSAVSAQDARPNVHEWAFGVALAVSTRGECVRRRVGAVIVSRRGRIIGAGYNGSEPGGPSCLKGQCPRAASGVSPGSSYDTGPGACHAVHAELNARLDVRDKADLEGASIFVTAEPCEGCLKILRADPFRWIHYLDGDGIAWSRSWPFR